MAVRSSVRGVGTRGAVSRAAALAAQSAASGRRFLLGVTGPPGAGKSTLASALVPFTIRAPESYAVLGASAVWTPIRWATFLAGGFAQTQLTGATDSRFVQITGYVSASFQTPDFP